MTVLDDFRATFDTRVQAPRRERSPARPALLTVLARALGTLAAILLGLARRGRSEVLTIVGLVFGVLAAFDYSRTAGLAVCAIAAFVLEWLIRE